MTVVRRTLRMLGRGVLLLLAALVLAELGLQAASLFARGRGAGWRPGAAHKILCVGDSHTFGAMVPPEESYPGHLQRLLDEHEPGAYSVVNLGIPGMNTSQVRARLRTALARERPDLVIVWCGVNDAWNRAESNEAPVGWSFAQVLTRLRVYRLVRTWWQDRHLEAVLAQILPSEQQRYRVLFQMDPATEKHQRVTVIDGDRTEQLAFDDTGFRADAEMEERAARDYRLMVEDCRAAGIPLVFIAYPLDADAFEVANRAVRRVATEYGVPVVESAPGVARVAPKHRQLLWAGHPNGPMYGEIARDVVRVVLRGQTGALGPLAEMTFDADAGSEGPVPTGTCLRTNTGCASGTGCYRWNPHGTVCNVQETVIGSQRPVRASARFRVAAFPTGGVGYDLLGLFEDTYGTGIYVQSTNRDQLRLLAMGSGQVEGTCGPAAAHLLPDVWYEVRVRAEKSNHARATLELLTAAGEVIDSVTCTDLPAGGGMFTRLSAGSTGQFGATADVTLDDVVVYEEPSS
jgi:lysophospholipase L1-like esterase